MAHFSRRVPRELGFLAILWSAAPTVGAQALPPIEIVSSFEGPPALPASGLVEGPDGAFYGTSGGGGANALGTVYRITAAGELRILHSFAGGVDGAGPQGGLVRVGDDFYGTTSGSPPASNGTVFRISMSGTFATVFSFGGTNGSRPYATLTLGSDGRLYGTTLFGGSPPAFGSNGTLYRLYPDGSGFEVLHSFGAPGDGRVPWAGVIEGEPGTFYGVTSGGGIGPGWGTLYTWDAAGGYAVLHSFAGGVAGTSPQGELFYDGSTGQLWGTTGGGGTTNCGTVFKRPPAAAVSVVHSFDCVTATAPIAGLVLGPDGQLWGTTYGTYSSGGASVFRIDPVDPSHPVSIVHAFPGGQVNVRGRLLVADDGRVYGTNEGVYNRIDRGSVFRIDPRAGNAFETLRAFGLADPGWEPQSLAAGSDGALYGTTHYGGSQGLGTAFRIGANGSIDTIHGFDDSAFQGGIPASTRLMWASDGMLYGTRYDGGAYSAGSIFSLTPAGDRTNLFDFRRDSYPYLDGVGPFATLTEASDGHLYGTTAYGGAANWGTVFRITKAGSLTKLYDFGGVSTGSEPGGRLVEGSDGWLYGTTPLNGWNGYSAGWGNIFRVRRDAPPSNFQIPHSFSDTLSGYSPDAGLVEAAPGRFFGTGRGGHFGSGVLFELTAAPLPVGYRVIHEFGGPGDGSWPTRELVRGSDGLLYGTTGIGGAENRGTVYRIREDGAGYELVHSFTGSDGSRADGLTPAPDGNLYGITPLGGSGGGGVVFRVRLTPICDAGGPYKVAEGGSVTVSATCNRAATFEWDLDGGGFATPGATVTFSAVGLDDPGPYTIRVRATDAGGLTDEDAATVDVTNVAPIVSVGPDVALIAGETLSRAGSFTDPGPDSWSATVDYGDGAAQPLVLAGKSFDLAYTFTSAGAFTVTVSVSDGDGGLGTDSLRVVVTSVEDSIAGLIQDIRGLIGDGRLNKGQGNSLISKLEAALAQLAQGHVVPALNQLRAFVNEVTADISSGKLTPAEGQPLIDKANRVIAALS